MFGKLLKRLLRRAAKPQASTIHAPDSHIAADMDSIRGAGWYFRGMGEWHGPFTIKELVDYTNNFTPAVMALDLNDQQISEINILPKTVYLVIHSSEMTSKVTKSIKELPDLHTISLWGQTITDESLCELANLKSLDEVRLVNTSCSEEGIRRLLESLPKCSRSRDPTQFHYGIRLVTNESGSALERSYELTPEGKMSCLVLRGQDKTSKDVTN